MKMTGEGGGGGGGLGGGGWSLLKEWTGYSLSRGLMIKLRWHTSIFLFQLS